MVVESILDAGLGAALDGPGPAAAVVFVMHHNGRGHILHSLGVD